MNGRPPKPPLWLEAQNELYRAMPELPVEIRRPQSLVSPTSEAQLEDWEKPELSGRSRLCDTISNPNIDTHPQILQGPDLGGVTCTTNAFSVPAMSLITKLAPPCNRFNSQFRLFSNRLQPFYQILALPYGFQDKRRHQR